MENLIKNLTERAGVLVLPLVLLVSGLIPCSASADGEMGLDRGRYGGGGEGDPLDGNESGGDQTGDDDIHDTAGLLSPGDDIFSRLMRATNVVLVPQYDGSILTFRVIFLAESSEAVEGRYAQ